MYCKPCAEEGCKTRPSIGVEGSKVGVYCRRHAKEGMVDVTTRRCAFEDCSKLPNFGYQGIKERLYCRQHAKKGMVDIVRSAVPARVAAKLQALA